MTEAITIYGWCVAGAALAFMYGGIEQVSIGDLLKRYQLDIAYVYIFMIDVLVYCFVGPLIVFAMYNPNAIYQAVSLGIGWPLVIRGLQRTPRKAARAGQNP